MRRRATFALLLALVAAPTRADEERAHAAAVHAAADSLLARIGPQGRFVYRLDARGRARAGYNVVRHAGALWALQHYHRLHPQATSSDALERSSRWLAECCLRPLPRWPMQALWSVPEGDPQEAKLGGAGLALAAWNGMAEQGLARPDDAALESLARFIVYLQRDDGSFHSKFRDGKRDASWVSLYYPGEAALGLLAQHRRAPDPLWFDAAARALEFLATSRAQTGAYLPDHWALIASADLARLEGAARATLVEHAARTAELMLSVQSPRGDFGHERRTAPAATRLEGLHAARELLGAEHPLRDRIDDALARGNAFLRDTQHASGAVPRGADDSIDPRRDELRIDDTQHALSVWMNRCATQKWSCTRP